MSRRTNFKEVLANLKSKDMTIRRITKDNPHGGYVSGYLVGDSVLPYPCRWQRLEDELLFGRSNERWDGTTRITKTLDLNHTQSSYRKLSLKSSSPSQS